MKQGQRDGLLKLSLWLHLLWLILVVTLLLFGPFEEYASNRTWLSWILTCNWCEYSTSAITSASEMGHLEIVGIGLTVLGTVLALGAFGSFFLIRSAAMDAAQEEAIDRIDKKLPDLLDDERVVQIITEPRFLLTLANQVKKEISSGESEMSEQDANDIASSMDGGEND